MGRSARMLIAVLVALVATLSLAAASAPAITVKVRVESNAPNQFQPSLLHGLVDRTLVPIPASPASFDIPDDVTPPEGEPQPTHACPASSALGALKTLLGSQVAAQYVTATGKFAITKIKNVPSVLGVNPPTWEVWVGGQVANDLCLPLTTDQDYYQVLAFPRCKGSTGPTAPNPCFPAGYMPLKLGVATINDDWPIAPYVTQGALKVKLEYLPGSPASATTAAISTDENIKPVGTDQRWMDGTASIPFTAPGDHILVGTDNFGIPDRIPVCSSNGADGFCGNPYKPPPDFVPPDGPCDTNGHDGRCGTVDTTGPPVEVNNIKDNQVFKPKKGPTNVNGITNFAIDPNGLRDVQIRLTRTVVQKVKVKPKKKRKGKAAKKKPKVRYRKVKTCTFWSDKTLLLERAKRCGADGGQWFQADLSDLRDTFTYDFAMRLPKGTYLLEVQSADENGSLDPPTPGRNILKFVVK